MRLVPLALVAALAVPALAEAAEVRTATRTQAVLPGATLVRGAAPIRFTLVGVDWLGSGSVRLRTRSLAGRWSAWRAAAPEPGDAPDGPQGPWSRGNPWWTGPSNRVEYQVRGDVRRLRTHYVWTLEGAMPFRRLAVAGAPPIVPRTAWAGSPTALRRSAPRYADAVRFAVVHHTAGARPTSRSRSAAIVRAVAAYHVYSNGWNDVGYNFLVDPWGQVFEGRYGGIDRNVVGAHAQGFNEGSVGIAYLGTYSSSSPTPAARDAIARLIAWRLDVAHVDPLVSTAHVSGGNPRYPAGVPVLLRAVSGHRDTYSTSCPGDRAYAQLPAIAQAASGIGLPKLYEPRVQGRPGGLVRFRARLSGVLPWTVTVTDADGGTVAAGSGTGPVLDWTWDARSAPPGRYTWTLGGGLTVRPASGTLLGPAAALSIVATATPATISPDADGHADAATIRYQLGRASAVTVQVLDSFGTPLSALPLGQKAAGSHTFTLTADSYPDGLYQLVLSAQSATGQVSTTIPVVVNRTLVRVGVTPSVLSPNGDGRFDAISLAFGLTLPAEIVVEAQRRVGAPAVVTAGPYGPGEHTLPWDGRVGGVPLADGAYALAVRATNTSGAVTQLLPLRIDTRAPVLRRVSRRPLRVRVGEPATVRLRVDGRLVVRRYARAGVFRLYVDGRRVTGYAEDAAGNRSLALRLR